MIVFGQVSGAHGGGMPGTQGSEFTLHTDATLADEPGHDGRVIVFCQVQIVGQGYIDPVLTRIAQIREQQSRLALIGHRELEIGYVEHRHILDPQNRVFRHAEDRIFLDG